MNNWLVPSIIFALFCISVLVTYQCGYAIALIRWCDNQRKKATISIILLLERLRKRPISNGIIYTRNLCKLSPDWIKRITELNLSMHDLLVLDSNVYIYLGSYAFAVHTYFWVISMYKPNTVAELIEGKDIIFGKDGYIYYIDRIMLKCEELTNIIELSDEEHTLLLSLRLKQKYLNILNSSLNATKRVFKVVDRIKKKTVEFTASQLARAIRDHELVIVRGELIYYDMSSRL